MLKEEAGWVLGISGHSTRRKRYSIEGSYACCKKFSIFCYCYRCWYYRKM